MTRICIYGAGAIGGLIAARLQTAGEAEVSCIARGPHLDAMRAGGLRLITDEGECRVQLTCTDTPADLGHQDFVIVALKAPSAARAAAQFAPLLGPETAVVTAQNGLPWWYFHAHGDRFDGTRLRSADPDGLQWQHIGPERAIGCVVYPAAKVTAPGTVTHVYGKRLTLGEPSGEKSERIRHLSDLLTNAGFKAPISPHIRQEIWMKLWGNLSFNPVSVLTHATLAQLTADKDVHAILVTMMEEARTVAETFGIRFRLSIERRVEQAGQVGEHKTSMLQDVELGRQIEIGVMVDAVQEVAALVDVATPTIDLIGALTRLRARTAGVL